MLISNKGQVEIWSDVNGYEEFYQVSSCGRVKSLRRVVKNSKNSCRIVSQRYLSLDNLDFYGYVQLILYKKGKKPKPFKVHILVGNAFIDNYENKPQINHKTC